MEGLNEALLAKANAAHLVKTTRVRADTTVVEANVAYPTDSGLLARGVARMARTIGRIKAAGLASRTATPDRNRAVHGRSRDIAANLRRRTDAAKDEVRAINADLIRIAERAVTEARAVVRNARRSLARTGTTAPTTVDALDITAERAERIAAQTRLRISGTTPAGSTRLVSLHDPDARPIAKGRLGKLRRGSRRPGDCDPADASLPNPSSAPVALPRRRRNASGYPLGVVGHRVGG